MLAQHIYAAELLQRQVCQLRRWHCSRSHSADVSAGPVEPLKVFSPKTSADLLPDLQHAQAYESHACGTFMTVTV